MPCQACKDFKEKHVRYKNTVRSGNPSDYTQACTDFDVPCPDALKRCTLNSQCRVEVCPGAGSGCPPPLAHSHLVTDECYYESYNLCDLCVGGYCQEWGGSCFASGLCSYDCDAGFVWNGSACVVAPVAAKGSSGNITSLIFIALSYLRLKKRKKRRVIASILT